MTSIPTTISAKAQKLLKLLAHQPALQCPQLEDLAGWQSWQESLEAQHSIRAQKALEKWEIICKKQSLGGVPVLELLPPQTKSQDSVLLFLHGGAFTSLQSFSQLPALAPLAARSGLKVLSIDYSLAPQAQWMTIQQEILTVIQELLHRGLNPSKLVLIGDSAGGNLALVSALAMRETLRAQPAGLILWSPWADLSNQGDSATTLKDFDPVLRYEGYLALCAKAYAGNQELTHSRISPIYADYRKGFPPTLIQESTRTIFLSTSVRLYRHLLRAGVDVSLDMYEGVPHGFQWMELPESEEAIAHSLRFISKAINLSISP